MAVVLLFFIPSCATVNHEVVSDYQNYHIRSVAILPVATEDVDLDAPSLFRPKLQKKLHFQGYECPEISYVDEKLRGKGINEGGEVYMMTAEELGNLLGVDAVLYSNVTEFNTTYLVVYASMTVSAEYKLVDCKTGTVLWRSNKEIKERAIGIDEDSIKKTLSFAALQGYEPYVQRQIDVSFSTLPYGPVEREAKPSGGCCIMP